MAVSDCAVSERSDVFKSYDIRGVLSDDFVVSLARRVVYSYGSVVVMSDVKVSSKRLAELFAKTVFDCGNEVICCGVGPTDMASVAGRHYRLTSVMFTASHLSEGQDGIKFHESNGRPFSPEMILGLKSGVEALNSVGGSLRQVSFNRIYESLLFKRYNELFNYDLHGLRVLVDLKNGCGLSHHLLSKLGAIVDVVHTKGSDPSRIEPELIAKAKNYDLVIVHDFDADRIVLVNESGVIHGSLVACMLTSVLKGVVVASVDSSEVLSNYTKVVHSRVGDPFVSRAILDNNAVLGVEPSGHYTDPCFAPTSSGSLFALILAGLVIKKGISERLSAFPSVRLMMDSIKVSDKDSFMSQLASKVSNVISVIDGVKFSFNGRPALIRPSGTEPIIRYQLENPGKDSLSELGDWLRKTVGV